MSDSICGMIGLAMRAGCVAAGTESAIAELQKHRSRMILMDEDASENTRKRLQDKCSFYHARLYVLPKGYLDRSLGKSGRMAAAVKTGNFDRQLMIMLDKDKNPAE